MSCVSIRSSVPKRSGRRQVPSSSANRTADIEVLIVDDQPVASVAVCPTSSGGRQIRVIANAQSRDEALRVARAQKPDVCMVSATLDGWAALARRLKLLAKPPRVLICGAPGDALLTGTAMLCGADGVCHRDAAPETLAEVIGRVVANEKLLPDLSSDQFQELLDRVDDADRAVVAMLLERTHPDDIASTLGLSARSLRMRRQSILARLDTGCCSKNAAFARVRHWPRPRATGPCGSTMARPTPRPMGPMVRNGDCSPFQAERLRLNI